MRYPIPLYPIHKVARTFNAIVLLNMRNAEVCMGDVTLLEEKDNNSHCTLIAFNINVISGDYMH